MDGSVAWVATLCFATTPRMALFLFGTFVMITPGRTNWGESLATLPEGFEMINHDLNRGVGGDDIFLAYRRRNDNADKLVTGLRVNGVYSPGTSNAFTWYVCAHGTSAIKSDLNDGAGGADIYLYYTNDHVEEDALPGKK